MLSAIHDPRANSTPSQLQAAKEQRARRQRLFAIPLKPAPEPSAVATPIPEVQTEFKEPWFSIDGEYLTPTIKMIQRVVADHFGLEREDLTCEDRAKPFIMPRHIAMSLCRSITQKSFPEIGRRFGGRDHTVPLYACKKIDRMAAENPILAADIEAIKAKLVKP